MKVIAAYKTDYFPYKGNISEEILVLEDGTAVYLSPDQADSIFPDLDEATKFATGEPTFSQSLLDAWSEGYNIGG